MVDKIKQTEVILLETKYMNNYGHLFCNTMYRTSFKAIKQEKINCCKMGAEAIDLIIISLRGGIRHIFVTDEVKPDKQGMQRHNRFRLIRYCPYCGEELKLSINKAKKIFENDATENILWNPFYEGKQHDS